MRLALISMPWAIFNRPSIQLGVLTSYIRQNEENIEVIPFHPYLGAAQEIGLETYRIISEDSWAGEALYCSLLFPEMYEQTRDVFYRSLGKKSSQLAGFDYLRKQLDTLLNAWVQETDLSSVSLAGFSVCFGQLPATLLAARRLKKKYPELQIVLGGSTCVPEIGASLFKVFSDVDFVIIGEGEQALLNLCRFIKGTTKEPGPGVLSKNKTTKSGTLRSSSSKNEVQDINTLPLPNYDSYFNELKRSGLGFIPQIPLEFSRGCWWNKCTFCNLNLQWCKYRFKKSKRMQDEVEQMAKKYRSLDFAFTDNALPPAEAENFFTSMQKNEQDLRFFAEIRTILKPQQYTVFHRGGLDSVQIGIEAFSGSLLRRMNKGVTVMDNLAAMKFCTEAGIRLEGNLILEFPGSTESEVEETLMVLDYAFPFRPLTGAGFFLGLGSPVWKEPGKYGISTIRHHPHNRKLYPGPVLNKLTLLILQGTGDRSRQRTLWQPVRKKIQRWQAFHDHRTSSSPALTYRDGGEFIIIRQEYPGKTTQQHRLTGVSRKIYLTCRTPVSIKSLLRDFNSVTERELIVFLDDLKSKRLLFQDGDMLLALAVHLSPNMH